MTREDKLTNSCHGERLV